ncbi:hypothetical protein Pla52o_33350 [Novipirellula galeiformis]|uniref:Uncharacterized protein n=1 Tax=Novipirellula galeiformis TaxID=2528004 RepID=A0A5C6CHR5_9BACT|nr:hypothetical protein Pla52o_33350 [Novipirellula galeiformis]
MSKDELRRNVETGLRETSGVGDSPITAVKRPVGIGTRSAF